MKHDKQVRGNFARLSPEVQARRLALMIIHADEKRIFAKSYEFGSIPRQDLEKGLFRLQVQIGKAVTLLDNHALVLRMAAEELASRFIHYDTEPARGETLDDMKLRLFGKRNLYDEGS